MAIFIWVCSRSDDPLTNGTVSQITPPPTREWFWRVNLALADRTCRPTHVKCAVTARGEVGVGWVALWQAFHQTRKCSFLMISPKLLDISPFLLLIFSPLGTADFLLLLELSGDGYSLLCSKKQPPRHSMSTNFFWTPSFVAVPWKLLFELHNRE